jgi:undecaprenyl-diphosphatase
MPGSNVESRHPVLRPLPVGLAVGFVAALLGFAFAKLADEVAEGDTLGFDAALLRFAQSLRGSHPWAIDVMHDLSSLGSTTALTLLTVFSMGFLAIVPARMKAALVLASVVSGLLVVIGFKTVFGRLRPDPSFADVAVTGLSFPSGHASMSAIVFLTLGALIASTRSGVAERGFILATAVLLTILVGVSRVALGVHWATDVLGGWAFGAGWALVWLLLDLWLGSRAAARMPGEA